MKKKINSVLILQEAMTTPPVTFNFVQAVDEYQYEIKGINIVPEEGLKVV